MVFCFFSKCDKTSKKMNQLFCSLSMYNHSPARGSRELQRRCPCPRRRVPEKGRHWGSRRRAAAASHQRRRQRATVTTTPTSLPAKSPSLLQLPRRPPRPSRMRRRSREIAEWYISASDREPAESGRSSAGGRWRLSRWLVHQEKVRRRPVSSVSSILLWKRSLRAQEVWEALISILVGSFSSIRGREERRRRLCAPGAGGRGASWMMRESESDGMSWSTFFFLCKPEALYKSTLPRPPPPPPHQSLSLTWRSSWTSSSPGRQQRMAPLPRYRLLLLMRLPLSRPPLLSCALSPPAKGKKRQLRQRQQLSSGALKLLLLRASSSPLRGHPRQRLLRE